MPQRKKIAHSSRLKDRELAALLEWIPTGEPWCKYGLGPAKPEGTADVNGLVSGFYHDFALKFCRDDDPESKRALWNQLGAAILREHVKYAPGTRPSAWWQFDPDAAEARRIVEATSKEDDEDGEGHDEDESERSYLERKNLLTTEEKKFFSKFGDGVRVRRGFGEVTRCEPCWAEVRQAAGKIGFDLDAAMKFEKLWIPSALFIQCDHEERFHGNDSIFEEI